MWRPLRAPRAVWRLVRMGLHIVHGLLIIWCVLPRRNENARLQMVRWWSAKLLRILGVSQHIHGQAPVGPKMLVANHVSWLDIAAIHAVIPEARFVSKADVKHWPVVGLLVASVGTLFIERSSKRDALRVVHQCAEALGRGDTIAVFPEGTTGPGPVPLPFHGNLLQAAIATETPVLPVLLRWYEPQQRFSTSAQFIGNTTLVASLWRVAMAQGLGLEMQLLPAQSSTSIDRRALAEHLRQELAQTLAR